MGAEQGRLRVRKKEGESSLRVEGEGGRWQWLVLTNGDKVKLQRNALSVIEAPSGHEAENEDNPFSSGTSLEDSIPRNAFKPRVQPRKPLVPVARNASMTNEEAMGAEHSAFNQMFERGNEGDEGLSPASEVLLVFGGSK